MFKKAEEKRLYENSKRLHRKVVTFFIHHFCF